jgi:hypothetical protein
MGSQEPREREGTEGRMLLLRHERITSWNIVRVVRELKLWSYKLGGDGW